MAQIESKKTVVKQVKPVVVPVIPPSPVIKTIKTIDKKIKISPRKLRLTVNAIKSFSPLEALNRLKFTNSKSARILIKAIKDILADAKNNFQISDPASLKFTNFRVDEGLKIKRMDKSHGSRFARGIIQKRHSRLTIEVVGQINNSSK